MRDLGCVNYQEIKNKAEKGKADELMPTNETIENSKERKFRVKLTLLYLFSTYYSVVILFVYVS